MDVLINNRQDKIRVCPEITKVIKKVVFECLKQERGKTEYEISVSLVNNEEIKSINKIYRGQDKSTDVLSFPIDDKEMESFNNQLPLLGDIIISLEKAEEQALKYNHSLIREVGYLTVHSMFHLMGYDHIKAEDKKIMRSKEKKVMNSVKLFKCK